MEKRDRAWSPRATSRPALVTYPPGSAFGPRMGEDFEFVWVTSGSAEWTWLDQNIRISLEPGTLLLTRPGRCEHFSWAREVPTRHGYVHFRLAPEVETATWPLSRPALAPGPVSNLLEYLLWLATEPIPGWADHVNQTLALLLETFVLAPLPQTRTPAEEHPALAAALDHVRHEWGYCMRPVTLDELAAAAHVTKEHLSRLFREQYDAGLISGLSRLRLDRAATLLTRTNLSVAEIAAECGFDDPLHFSKRFTATHGVSPRNYRRGAGSASQLPSSLLMLRYRTMG
jgi:AraC family transcriptional regulator